MALFMTRGMTAWVAAVAALAPASQNRSRVLLKRLRKRIDRWSRFLFERN
jgi:hypothetical protein